MASRQFDDVHNHATWGPLLRAEAADEARLHRHRIADRHSVPRFTSWEHNGPNHSHRLPDGAWTRPRVDLRPPAAMLGVETLDDRADGARRAARQRSAP